MKNIIKVMLFLLITSITGCYYDTEERLYPNISTPCDDTIVTFSKTVKPILNVCQTCHSNSSATSSGGGIKLENYADVVSMVTNGRLMGSIRHESGYLPMPDGGGKLQDCEINQLQVWIDNGTLNN